MDKDELKRVKYINKSKRSRDMAENIARAGAHAKAYLKTKALNKMKK